MKKKITMVFVAILVLFNFICVSSFASQKGEQYVQAEPIFTVADVMPSSALASSLTESALGKIDTSDLLQSLKTGNVVISSNGRNKTYKLKEIIGSTSTITIKLTMNIVVFLVRLVNNIPQLAVEAMGDKVESGYFTIYDLVIGNYSFFNMDYYNIKNMIPTGATQVTGINATILKYYFVFRILAIAASLFVLIYIGIRMAISTAADDRAKYSKMLTSWAVSLALLFVMHYIIILICFVTNIALDIVKDLAQILGVNNIEEDIFSGVIKDLSGVSGFKGFVSLFTVMAFLYYQFKFLFKYVRRACEIAILITFSPLVTITYSIDKVGDNKAQAFSTWLHELISQYMMQPIHAVMYIIFIAIAGEIAKLFPILGVFFLFGMGKAEEIAMRMFNLGIKDKRKGGFKPPRLPKMFGGKKKKA